MLYRAERLCAIAACLLLLACGRIGVFPIEQALGSPGDAEPDVEPVDVPDAGRQERPEAGSVDADADLPPTQPADASHLDATHFDVAQPPVPEAGLDAQEAGLDAQATSSDAEEASAPQDSALEASADVTAPPTCDGEPALGLCWYLGAEDQSCREACSGHGGFDDRAVALVGTEEQGGSLDNCRAVLAALGYRGSVGEGVRPDGIGIGCHRWDADAWWLVMDADFHQDAHGNPARIACACTR